MIKEFFDITNNKEDTLSLFFKLAITKSDVYKEIASHPMIYFSFKGMDSNNYISMKEKFIERVYDEYHKYYLLFKGKIDINDDRFERFFTTYNNLKNRNIDDGLLSRSLLRLSEALYIYYGKKSIIIIDEYNQPIVKAYSFKFIDELRNIYNDFLSDGLKSNKYLYRAILNGIQRMAKESIFSGLNNLDVFTVLDEKYSQFFGLNTKETNELLSYYNLVLDNDVKEYYDGYRFDAQDIYNPWSIIKYASRKILEPYWIKTSDNLLVKESMLRADKTFLNRFDELVNKGQV
jgi:hypothetical protein